MKVVHLFSNWKWTGPAEPALNLCLTLNRRHETVFIPGGFPRPLEVNEIASYARERGIEPVDGFRLEKHFHPIHNARDMMKLRRFLRDGRFDIVHCHLPNDHLVAAGAVLWMKERPAIVRSYYDVNGPGDSFRAGRLLSRFTQGATVISHHAGRFLVGRNSRLAKRMAVVPGGVDIARFDPGAVDRGKSRSALGLGENDFALGIVARMQRHRKFDLLLDAFRRARGEEPRLRLVIVGRGTHQDEVAKEPARRMGLQDHVIFTGYIQGESYVRTLRALDSALFLVPGSDGSCRAVREKMAMGLPVIASRRTPLDEMVDDGRCGIVVDPIAEALADSMVTMARNEEATISMGRRAREKAVEEYSLETQADRVEELYRLVLDR